MCGTQDAAPKQVSPGATSLPEDKSRKGGGGVGTGGSKLDPVLAKRLSQQLEKCDDAGFRVGDVGSLADNTTKLDPDLAERLAKQLQKWESGPCTTYVRDANSSIYRWRG